MLREKAQHGNSSRKYWQLFADCLIEKAEAAGKIDRTTVNGVSIYDDDFAGLVLDSIKTRGVMMIERNR